MQLVKGMEGDEGGEDGDDSDENSLRVHGLVMKVIKGEEGDETKVIKTTIRMNVEIYLV